MKPITVEAATRETLDLLTLAGDSPQLDTEMLLERVTGFSRSQQRLRAAHPLTEQQYQDLQELSSRRRQGEPMAYILGERGFWSLQLRVSPAVLIPRPETELVVERALKHLPENQNLCVLDLGTGSGAIALAIAVERPLSHVLGSDASPAALEIADENARRHAIQNVEFVASDWFEQLSSRRYALIASNPPYIATGDPDLESTVSRYEPHSALFAGTTGLDALCAIIGAAPRFLEPGGWLVLEHGWQQALSVRRLLESSGFSSVASHADLAGHERVTEGQLNSGP